MPILPPDFIKQIFRATFDFLWVLKWHILAFMGFAIGLLLLRRLFERLLKIKIARNIILVISLILIAIFIFWVYR